MTNEEFEKKLSKELDALTEKIMVLAKVESKGDPILSAAACAQAIGYLMAIANTDEEGCQILFDAIRSCQKRAAEGRAFMHSESTALFEFKTRKARQQFILDCQTMDPEAEFVTSQDKSQKGQKGRWIVGVRASA
jgi:hypothetical protein